MYVDLVVFAETQPHEKRVALVPAVVPKLVEPGARLHMQTGAGRAVHLPDAAFEDVVFMDGRLWRRAAGAAEDDRIGQEPRPAGRRVAHSPESTP